MTEIAPWFPLHVDDFWSAREVEEMGTMRAGLYLRLLSYQWKNISIPADLERLAAILRITSLACSEAWPFLQPCFVEIDGQPGRLWNTKLQEIRVKAYQKSRALRDAGARGGKKSAEKAREKIKPGSKPGLQDSSQNGKPGSSHPDEIAHENSSLAISLSREEDKKEEDVEILPTVVSPGGQGEDSRGDEDELGEDVARPRGAGCDTPADPAFSANADSSAAPVGSSAPSDATEGRGEREDLPLLSGVAQTPEPERVRRRIDRSPEDVAAHEILDKAWPIIERNVPDLVLTQTDWRRRNKAGALAFVKAGVESAAIVAALEFAHRDPTAAQYYGGLNRLDKLAEAIPRLRMMRSEKAAQPRSTGPMGALVR